MAIYTPPPKNNIPFSFSTGGYQPPDFADVRFNFQTRAAYSQTAELQAAINVMGLYQRETYSFLRYCERYIVGYTNHGVQILTGRCFYGGIRDIGGFIRATKAGQSDLPAFIEGYVPSGTYDLPAFIGGHLPRDLSAFIRGLVTADLPASVRGVVYNNLPAYLGPVPPEDLPAYLKVWPQQDLPGSLRGWAEKDLGGILNIIFKSDLPAIIGGHRPSSIYGIIRGWVREAYADLPAFIRGSTFEDITAIIVGVLKKDLPAYLYAIQPKNLPAYIRGWDTKDLPASIIGDAWPWDLPASIVSTGGFNNLPATIISRTATLIYRDLPAYILGTRGRQDLPAYTRAVQARNLQGIIDTGRDIGNLPASITPKMIRLTGIINIVTMEHSDLTATISIPCFYSDFRDLSGYINTVFLSDLGAIIYPKDWAKGTLDLGARCGYASHHVVQDKLPINLTIVPVGYRTEDKYHIYLRIYRSALNLGAAIYGEYISVDIPASIFGVPLYPYEFDNFKFREYFYTRTYGQIVRDFQEVDVEFESIVRDYIYSSGGNVVAKTNRYERFLTKVSSYYSPETAALLGRSIHKTKKLYNLDGFSSIDEAMRYAIHYVTTDFYSDLRSIINAVGMYSNLSAYLNGTTYVSDSIDLTSAITGTYTHSYDVVVAFTDDGVGYLTF